MNIEIKGFKDTKFALKSDDLQVTLYEVLVQGEKAKYPGKEYMVVVGYYASVEAALESLLSFSIKRSEATSLRGLKDDIRKIKEIIENILK